MSDSDMEVEDECLKARFAMKFASASFDMANAEYQRVSEMHFYSEDERQKYLDCIRETLDFATKEYAKALEWKIEAERTLAKYQE